MKTVTIQGQNFEWDEINGLDSSVIQTVQHWIKKQAKHYFPGAVNLNLEINDLIQAGNMGALKAARTYHPEFGTGFLTWANFRIVDEMRRLCRHPIILSLDTTTESSEYPGLIVEHIADPTDQADRANTKVLLSQLMKKLTKQERLLLKDYYGIGANRKPQSLRNLSKKYGVSAQCVNNRLKKTLYKLRAKMSESI